MNPKPGIAIVGSGNLASALVVSLHQAGYEVTEVLARSGGRSLRSAQALARKVGGRASVTANANLNASVVWLCVPDAMLASAATDLAKSVDWTSKAVLHSSGALASDELSPLRRRGASVASAHPLMTFVRGSRPSLARVSFAIEGDAFAVRVARRIVKSLDGQSFSISKADKAAYHAWGTFASPLFTSLLATSERVAGLAGVPSKAARRRMIPILRQTLANYASFGAAGSFSGPIVRGDIQTVRRHLQVLRKAPYARDVYLALARAALLHLPHKNAAALKKVLRG